MKKLVTCIAVIAMAGIVAADLVDGGFDGTILTNVSNMADANSSLGVWETYYNATWLVSGGRLVRNCSDSTGASARRAAQIFTADLTAGDYSLKLDYDFIGGDLGDVTVSLLYYDGNGAALVYDNRQQGYQSALRTGVQTGYTVSLLGSTQLATGSYTDVNVINFNVASDYSGDRLMVVIDTINLASSNTLSFDNISVAAVPEPATGVLIGIGGAVAFWGRRRIRRKDDV